MSVTFSKEQYEKHDKRATDAVRKYLKKEGLNINESEEDYKADSDTGINERFKKISVTKQTNFCLFSAFCCWSGDGGYLCRKKKKICN